MAMEVDEITSILDVKLDLKERKNETVCFRNWIKCNVKVEAIKCFPSYMRITIKKISDDISEPLCVRINIPGLTVRYANSRSKAHSYGLFWKHNRKRCCIFLALDSPLNCEKHIKWMKQSIKSLETYRQDILEKRRLSRSKPELATNDYNINSEIFIAKKTTKNLQDILGPLPKVPDFNDGNWSRRISGMSGIYEEIPDDVANSQHNSRASAVSGIYEEMKPPTDIEKIRESLLMTPPPLPPRQRLNTSSSVSETENIPRSYTNPESDLGKKKKYLNVLESVFGRSRRSGSFSEYKINISDCLKSPDEVEPKTKKNTARLVMKPQPIEYIRTSNKRNSFSSPDLTKFSKFDPFDALDDLSSVSSELYMLATKDSAVSNEFVNLEISSPNNTIDQSIQKCKPTELNISEQIQSNFNFSCNSSSINLAGANINVGKTFVPLGDDDLSGYCVMAPIRKDRKKSMNDSDKENESSAKISEVNYNKDVYENMNAPSQIILEDKPIPSSTDRISNIYENIADENDEANPSRKQCEESSENKTLSCTPRKSTCIDEKVPSYYPNDSCDIVKYRRRHNSTTDQRSINKNSNNTKLNCDESYYMSSPQKLRDMRKSINIKKKNCTENRQISTFLLADKTLDNIYVEMKRIDPPQVEDKNSHGDKLIKSLSSADTQADKEVQMVNNKNLEVNKNCLNNERTPRIYQKYATLSRMSPNKYLEKYTRKTSDVSSAKKFTSLPRFKKIDLSPLKIKISSVLHRHHSDGF